MMNLFIIKVMMHCKRQRERIRAMMRKKEKYARMSTIKNCSSIERPKEEKEKEKEKDDNEYHIHNIPGFYYDFEKQKYFSNKNSHMERYEDYLKKTNQQQIQIFNFMKKENQSVGKKQNLEQSLFLIHKKSKLVGKQELLKSKNLCHLKCENVKRNTSLISIRHQIKKEISCIYYLNDICFVIVLNNTEGHSVIHIQKITFKNQEMVNEVVNKIFFQKYKGKCFTNLKIIKGNLLIFQNYELFLIKKETFEQWLTNDMSINPCIPLSGCYVNFNPSISQLRNIPLTFEWPVVECENIQEYTFIALIYKHLIFISCKFQPESSSIRLTSIIDMERMVVGRAMFTGNITRKHTFSGYSYSTFRYHEKLQLIFLCENRGDIHIYDKSMNILNIIPGIGQSRCIVDIIFTHSQSSICLLYSDHSVCSFDFPFEKRISLHSIYMSKLSQLFDNRNRLLYSENWNYIYFKNEEGIYMLISLNDHKSLKNFLIEDPLMLYALIDRTLGHEIIIGVVNK